MNFENTKIYYFIKISTSSFEKKHKKYLINFNLNTLKTKILIKNEMQED